MGIRSLTAFPRPTPPAPAKRVARKEKQRVSQVSPRWLLGFPFHAPCAAKRPHGPPSFAELLPRGGTEPAPYRPTENTLKQHPAPPPGWFPKEGPAGPFFGRFKEGLGGKSKSLPEFFLGSARGYSFNSERIPPRKLPIFIGTIAPAGTAGPPGPNPGPTAAGLPGTLTPPRAGTQKEPPPSGRLLSITPPMAERKPDSLPSPRHKAPPGTWYSGADTPAQQ